MAKKSAQISVRMDQKLYDTLTHIEERHGITSQEIARRCLEQIVEFYEKNGWFGFPLKIEPPTELLKEMLAKNPSLELTKPPVKKSKKKKTEEPTVLFFSEK